MASELLTYYYIENDLNSLVESQFTGKYDHSRELGYLTCLIGKTLGITEIYNFSTKSNRKSHAKSSDIYYANLGAGTKYKFNDASAKTKKKFKYGLLTRIPTIVEINDKSSLFNKFINCIDNLIIYSLDCRYVNDQIINFISNLRDDLRYKIKLIICQSPEIKNSLNKKFPEIISLEIPLLINPAITLRYPSEKSILYCSINNENMFVERMGNTTKKSFIKLSEFSTDSLINKVSKARFFVKKYNQGMIYGYKNQSWYDLLCYYSGTYPVTGNYSYSDFNRILAESDVNDVSGFRNYIKNNYSIENYQEVINLIRDYLD